MEKEPIVKTVKYRYSFDFCYVLIYLGFYLASAIIQNQVLLQTCQTSGYSQEICSNLHADNETRQIEVEVQPKAAAVNAARVMLNSLFPPIISLLLGSWSDVYGRKPIMMMSFIGYTTTIALFTIFTYISDHIVTLSPWMLFIAEIPMTLMGGWPLLDVATGCYVTDISEKSKHSTRLSTLSFLNMAMSFIANMSSSYILEATSSTIVFLISLICCLIGLFIVIFVVEESIAPPRGVTAVGKVRAIFKFKVIDDIWKTLTKQTIKYRRKILWSAMAIIVLSVFTIQGSSVVLFYSGQRRFGWQIKDYTTFRATQTGIIAVGIGLTVIVSKFIFKMSDFHLGLLALLSGIIESLIDAAALESYHMYIGAVFGAMRILAIPVFKSIISNVFPQNEIAKIYSASTALEAFSGFVAGPLYNVVYENTLETFPGAFFLITTSVFLLSGVLAVAINIWTSKNERILRISEEGGEVNESHKCDES